MAKAAKPATARAPKTTKKSPGAAKKRSPKKRLPKKGAAAASADELLHC